MNAGCGVDQHQRHQLFFSKKPITGERVCGFFVNKMSRNTPKLLAVNEPSKLVFE